MAPASSKVRLYVDVALGRPHEFTARGDVSARPGERLVVRSELEYPRWNRLIGIDNPGRLDLGD
jgi:hypothetical protein